MGLGPIMIIAPAIAIIMFVLFEMPRDVRRLFFRIPIFISGLGLGILVGILTKGVTGPVAGFVTKLLMFPTLMVAKGIFNRSERKLKAKEAANGTRIGNGSK